MGQSSSKQNTETEDEKESLCLLLMGKTGHGKSSLGNCILGHEAFKVSSDTGSQTAEIEFAYSDVESFLLKVVDGPGLLDTQLSELNDTQRAVHNMSKALAMSCEGVDAFLFVFRFGVRFTSEEVSVLKTLQKIFGKDYFKHAIVVLTHGDQFEMNEGPFDDWCKKQTGPFKQLYEACDGRCVLFNNKDMEEEVQRKQLTQLAHDLNLRHGRYTAACFEQAAEERERMIITLKEPILKEDIQKQAGILSSKIEKYQQQPCTKQKAEVEGAIRKLKNKIKTEDKGQGLLKDLMKNVEEVERNLHDAVKLHKLVKRLENTRKAAQIWSKIGNVCSVVGGALTLVDPEAGRLFTLGFRAVDALGSGIINTVEHTTETNMRAMNSNMSTTAPASNAT